MEIGLVIRVKIIGRGSAAKRHDRVLTSMGHAIVTENPDYVVIASLTSKHRSDLTDLYKSGFRGKCLVEKPLFMEAADFFKPEIPIYVAYQMRFHPVIAALKRLLNNATVYSAHIYAGQHISLWGGTYHADKSKGGGVLRDYSHELDLVQWLFGRVGDWGCWPSDDEYCYAFCRQAGETIISMQLNYLDTHPKREWIINSNRESIRVDLINNTINGVKIHVAEDEPTRLMHEAILGDGRDVCTFDEGLAINHFIDRMES